MLAVAGTQKRKRRAVGLSLWDASGGGDGGGGGIGPEAVPAASPGLALLHRKEKREIGTFVLNVPEGGKCVKLTRIAGERGKPAHLRGRRRGKIHGLSVEAGLRLRRAMLSVNQEKVGEAFFVSNSVPLINDIPEQGWAEFNKSLESYKDRFEYRWREQGAFIVKELTEKGCPHLHMVIPWAPGKSPTWAEFVEWNDKAWADAVGSKHPKHRERGCRVELCRSWEGAASYLSCYLNPATSDDPRMEDSGKMWGCIGRRYLPIDWKKPVEMTANQGKAYARALLKLQRKKRTHWLVSKQTHTMKENWGKPVEWRRLKFQQRMLASDVGMSVMTDDQLERVHDQGARFVNLDLRQQVMFFKDWGFKVKKIVPSCCRRVKIPLWSADAETGKMECAGRSTGKVYDPVRHTFVNGKDDFAVPCERGEEIHSFSSGWHHIDVKEAMRLLAFIQSSPDRLTRCERRWAEKKRL